MGCPCRNKSRKSRFVPYVGLMLCVLLLAACKPAPAPEQTYQSRPVGSVTFSKDIAPIVFQNCTPCHQEGQPGPFELLNYADVKKRAEQIVEVTQSRFMPPWLPEDGHEKFADSRKLSAEQLGLIRQWVSDGAPEGTPGVQAPAAASTGWKLGEPDLIVEMPDTYLLPAEGRDVYRNFVVPLSLEQRRYIRAIEFQPRTKVIHHAFMVLDSTRQSRRLDATDAECGFGDIALPPYIESPGGYFLSWQPGRDPVRSLPGMAWTLRPRQDIVLQLHMQPTGAEQPVRPAIGIYFTEEAPTNAPLKIALSSYKIDIAPGESSFEISDRFVMPADAHILSVMPHAHFLARTVEGHAVLPDGTKQPLIQINDWNFNWQSDYRFAKPLFLPKGTELVMRFTYDNSTNNIRNPNQPPTRVTYGPQTQDEMGELWIQLLCDTPQTKQAWQLALQERLVKDALDYNTLVISRNPTNAHAHVQLSKAFLAKGEEQKAFGLLQRAIALNPAEEEAHYNLGVVFMEQNQNRAAAAAFSKTLNLNPENIQALNNLGLLLLQNGQFDSSERVFHDALRINPDDEIVKSNLELLARTRKARKS